LRPGQVAETPFGMKNRQRQATQQQPHIWRRLWCRQQHAVDHVNDLVVVITGLTADHCLALGLLLRGDSADGGRCGAPRPQHAAQSGHGSLDHRTTVWVDAWSSAVYESGAVAIVRDGAAPSGGPHNAWGTGSWTDGAHHRTGG